MPVPGALLILYRKDNSFASAEAKRLCAPREERVREQKRLERMSLQIIDYLSAGKKMVVSFDRISIKYQFEILQQGSSRHDQNVPVYISPSSLERRKIGS